MSAPMPADGGLCAVKTPVRVPQAWRGSAVSRSALKRGEELRSRCQA